MNSRIFIAVLTACFLKVLAEKRWFCMKNNFLELKFFPREYPDELKCDWKDSMIEDFTNSVCLMGLEEYFYPNLHPKAPDCYLNLHDEFVKFIDNFIKNIHVLQKNLHNDFPKEYKNLTEHAMISLHGVKRGMLELKYDMRPAVVQKKYSQIPEILKNSTIDINKSQKKFFLTLNYLRPADSKCVGKGEREFKKLRKEGSEKSKKIFEKFETCINSL